MFKNTLGKKRYLHQINYYLTKLTFIFSPSMNHIRFSSVDTLEKLMHAKAKDTDVLGVYTSFHTMLPFFDLSHINWHNLDSKLDIKGDSIEANSVKANATERVKKSRKRMQKMRVISEHAKTTMSPKVKDTIEKFSKVIRTKEFFDKYVDTTSPIGFLYKNVQQPIEKIYDELGKVGGAKDINSPNKYSFVSMFQFNMFSFPHDKLIALIHPTNIFPAGVQKNLFKRLNNITNMNYLKDYDINNHLITPGYKNVKKERNKKYNIKPTWALRISDDQKRLMPFAYPISFSYADFGHTSLTMRKYFIPYQGNMNGPWKLDKILDKIDKLK